MVSCSLLVLLLIIIIIVSCSLQALHKRFFEEEACQGWKRAKLGFLNEYWHSDQDIVSAIWHLVRMCSLDDTDNFATLVSDFVSRVLLFLFSPFQNTSFGHVHIF